MAEATKPTLAAFFPHPDDESYAAAGLLAQTAHHADVNVVCATRGEAGPGFQRTVGPGPQLAALRTQELTASCAVMGLPPPRFLDFPDGALDHHEDSLAQAIAAIVQTLQPQVVVSLGPEGAYGHRDHVVLTAALDRVLKAQAHRRWLWAHFESGFFDALRARLRRAAPHCLEDTARSLPEPRAPNRVLEIHPDPSLKLAAIGCHCSQLRDGDPHSLLGPTDLNTLLKREQFVVAQGPPMPPEASDPFAGLL